MPVVRVSMWSGRTHAQKQELARAITEVVCAIAETTPEATTIIFEDVERSNWAQAGLLASDEGK
jgi:4-oxalocrotonate tautomerase